ncbi:MAG TPA: hypothetical protein VMV10_21055 [Pirellulales bacterium]|nr:hypothetical protein [Pirellulales bacterium]
MIGHGGPSPSHAPATCWMRVAACWVVSLALAPAAAYCAEESVPPSSPAEPAALRLRIEWGFGPVRAWQGTISVGEGRIAAPQPLGIEADEAGSIWLEDGRLNVRERGPRLYDGVDFDIHAPPDAVLVVDLKAQDGDASDRVEIPLASLVNAPQNRPLDDRGNRLLLRRAPGDRLRVSLGATDRLVFGGNEQLDLEVQPHRIDAPRASKLRLLSRLLDPRNGNVLWSQEDERVVDDQGSTEPVALAVALPEVEGVYDLAIEASRRGLPNRFGWKHVVDERRVQLVVLSENPHVPDAGSTPPTDVVVEIDPANPAWWKRIAAIPMLPGLPKGSIGAGDLEVWRHPGKLGSLVRLGPGGREPNIAWVAYPLPIQRPGQAHIIEVEYPSDVPQNLGISLVEPDSAGAVLPWGVDSGVYLPGDPAGDEPRLATHRLICWPRTKTPLLLLTNRRDGSHALFGKIRVRGPKVNPVVTMVKTVRDEDEVDSYLPRRFPPGDGSPRRLLAAYYDRPLFPENFSAPDAFDPANKRSFDDWHTFYQGAVRLADYLNHVGHNGLMLSVLADGCVIYPSQRIDSTPRYDTGVFFSNGQDPLRKDVLELLFRIFDREGLTLIPAVDFSMPLKSLEALRRSGGAEAEGLELIGADGASWLETHPPRQGLAPYYNPLHERVQEEMLAVLEELTARYSGHRSFGGVAVQLSADGYAQLPGADWGYDDQTLARFQRDSGVKLPAGPERFAERVELLQGRDRQTWLRWRAGALSLFYRRAQAELATEKPHARLYLAGARLFERLELKRELEPVLSRSATKNQDVLLSLGIDPELFRDLDDVVLLRPQRIAPLDSLSQQAANLEVNLDSNLDRQFAGAAHGGSLFYHEPQEARLESFDAKSPFTRTYAWLAAQPLPSGAENRRRFVHALAALDAQAIFDGGRMLPLGQERELDDLIAVYRQLPEALFETLSASPATATSEAPRSSGLGAEGLTTQPVTIRTLSLAGRTYAYMVNDSPWNASVKVSVDMPDCGVRSLNPTRRRVPALEGEGHDRTWTIALEPYDVFGAVFTSPSVKFSNPQVSLDERIASQLMDEIDDLFERATVLKDPPPLDVLQNAGFEQTAPGGVAGWDATPASVKLDAANPHSGKYAVKLSSGGGPATFASAAFPAPRTGWLSVSVWLRTADAARQPPLWLLLEGRFAGQSYVRKAPVGQGLNAKPLKSAWSQYVFVFPELPTEGISPLRLRFHLERAGDVWIDDIELCDLEKLNDRQSLALAMSIQLARLKLDKRQYADCRQLLEGYWPRYLTSNVQLTNRPIDSRPPERREPPPVVEPKPSMVDRLKGLFR